MHVCKSCLPLEIKFCQPGNSLGHGWYATISICFSRMRPSLISVCHHDRVLQMHVKQKFQIMQPYDFGLSCERVWQLERVLVNHGEVQVNSKRWQRSRRILEKWYIVKVFANSIMRILDLDALHSRLCGFKRGPHGINRLEYYLLCSLATVKEEPDAEPVDRCA